MGHAAAGRSGRSAHERERDQAQRDHHDVGHTGQGDNLPHNHLTLVVITFQKEAKGPHSPSRGEAGAPGRRRERREPGAVAGAGWAEP
ncbi:hypothetical protein Hesp01_07800 [Herbidospora sp. NBRC 101105]|nr:hypothetical protein Hesp01_07800 [Herbidospora sp. NBRC 101105]